MDFAAQFKALTGNPPFPWQEALYKRFVECDIPESCILPTGLGKTSVIAVWLIALANGHPVPRRLVYVVNRRTVVDQTTDEVEKYRKNLGAAGITQPLAISTLRGQFADNREWSADPSKPAVICGTVDMIGSRLLFSGYGIGFKQKPLHAGFLGQDALLVHDEAHLEPAFQDLLTAIKQEQSRCKDKWPLRVMELTATSRSGGEPFQLSDADRAVPEVDRRIRAKKVLSLIPNKDDKKLAEEIAARALSHEDGGRAILIFVRRVEDVEKIVKKLPKDRVEQLTGTLRGLERDGLVKRPIFQRFLPESNRDQNVPPAEGTVYLVCTSAGEVGVNISADHLVCDLSTFDSMAQRFGRVNRFGQRDDTRIDVIHPETFDEELEQELRLARTLALLKQLNGDASPAALGELPSTDRVAAFAPPPTILPTSDILFDSWALTTIRGKLPGRPAVEPYLHGISEWQPPETHVAWREEVEVLNPQYPSDEERIKNEAADRRRLAKFAEDLLDDYPLKPHELLRDASSRVFARIEKLDAEDDIPAWLVADDATVMVTTLGEIRDEGKEFIEKKTLLLPPSAGGLERGLLVGDSTQADDVSDQIFDSNGNKRRLRLWDDADPPAKMRLIRKPIDTNPDRDETDEEETGRRFWKWYELIDAGDSDGSKSNVQPVAWSVHVGDVVAKATGIAERLPLADDLRRSLDAAARLHDHGKRRRKFQFVLGNLKYAEPLLAKSGRRGGRLDEPYRHEFGSLLDAMNEAVFTNLSEEQKDLVLHLIAVHHGYGRPHFPKEMAFDLEPPAGSDPAAVAAEVPRRFARLQRAYGRWGLACLESLLRAADWAASAQPSAFLQEDRS